MSLITCLECGHQVSTLAAACPSCGSPPRQGTTASQKVLPPQLPADKQPPTSSSTQVPTVTNSPSVSVIGDGLCPAVGTSAAMPAQVGEIGKGPSGFLPNYFWWSILASASVVAAPIGMTLALARQRDGGLPSPRATWAKAATLVAIVWAAFFSFLAFGIFLFAITDPSGTGPAVLAWTLLGLNLIVLAWIKWKHNRFQRTAVGTNQFRPTLVLNDAKTAGKAPIPTNRKPTETAETFWQHKVPYWHVPLAVLIYSMLFKAGCYERMGRLWNDIVDPPNQKSPASPSSNSWPRPVPTIQQRIEFPPLRDTTSSSQ